MDYKEAIRSVQNTLHTVSDRNSFLEQLELFHNQLFMTNPTNQLLMKNVKLFEDLFDNCVDKVHLISDLKQAVLEMKVVDMIIAFEPRVKDVERVSLWLKQHIGENTLVEIVVDPGIIGGSKISIDGLFKDSSVLQKLDSYWESEGQNWFKTLGLNQ